MPSVIEKFRKLLLPSGLRKSSSQNDEKVSFKLMLEDSPIGELNFKEGEWVFFYHMEFVKEHDKGILADFPDLNKVYKSTELWPFFASRIPSSSRSSINESLKKEGIDESDLTKLLAFFGKKTIANPFTLKLAY